jgi:AhpC/TSA family
MSFLRDAIILVLSGHALVIGFAAKPQALSAAEPIVSTILSSDRSHEITPAPVASQPFPRDQLWAPLDDLPKLLGVELKPEGVCVGEVCMPLDAEARRALVKDHAGRSHVELLGLAARLNQPVAAERDQHVWSFGEIPAVREATWSNAEAPDFTLPNREGKEVRLSDFRGKKVLILTWASW